MCCETAVVRSVCTELSNISVRFFKRIKLQDFQSQIRIQGIFNILNIGDAIRLCRFRKTNHYLPIETGRWRNIERGNRYCNLCNCQKLGDEYHYVLECSSLHDKCKQLLPTYFMKRHNVVKLFELLSTKKQSLLRKLCIFIKHINKVVLYSWLTHCCSLSYLTSFLQIL